MTDRWVINASPLIVLSKIDQQELLWQLATELVVPDAVFAEVNAGPAADPARLYLEEIQLVAVPV